jgi:UDP-N-acetylmuramate dehydrogenase
MPPGRWPNAPARMLEKRRAGQPLDKPTCGSVFKNPKRRLCRPLDRGQAALRDTHMGGALVSPKHANFIENRGGATASDIARRSWRTSVRVVERDSGVRLEPEVEAVEYA